MIDAIGTIILAALYLYALKCLVLLIKCENTFRQRERIIDAIQTYNAQCVKARRFNELIPYERMRDYDACWKDILDWGYKHILPEQEYCLIEPFIRK